MNQPHQTLNQRFKPLIKRPQGNHGDGDADWLVVCEISLNLRLRINPDPTVRVSFPRGPSCRRVRTWKSFKPW
ncbi:MAG: hypothetical protein MRECE_7c006 [Mycoplasmataceae bacterium CE_OT135]|nr:MAG: hypothetical protein MRECE_7c006 [Mycoplasmataceae bacterium CE_OT135]